MNIVYISDYFLGETNGGAEQNDAVLLDLLEQRGHKIIKEKSDHITHDFLEEHREYKFLISNFIFMFNSVKDKIISLGLDYIIIEHDHKYLMSRDPSIYKDLDYVAPKKDLVNVSFYENARGILCQSSLHSEIAYSNLELDTIYNVGGNLWTEEVLSLLEELAESPKKENTASVMVSGISHKNTQGAIQYCQKVGLDYVLLNSMAHKEFLECMAQNDTFVFFPLTIETLSRIVVEARMMNCKVKTSVNIGAASESWFTLKGKELIEIMRNKRTEIPDLVEKILEDE